MLDVCLKGFFANLLLFSDELTAVLAEFTELDLGDLKITLDLNCLTLPVDLESLPPKKPSFMRMFSNSSLTGQSPTGSVTEEGGLSTMYVLMCFITI